MAHHHRRARARADFQAIADAYTAAHPNVTIKITVLENEAFKTKLADDGRRPTIPDLFQSWGGGIMAAQADAGLLKDITADIASWKDTINPGAMSIYAYNGKQYGVPWDMGMIGFWYNKDAFAQAGITAPPATWDEYLADVEKLKAAGIDPLAIAGKDKWPSMHLWTYLVLRNGGGDALAEMIQSGNWNTDACTKAGEDVLALNALDPYQAGYKSADYNAEAAVGRQRQGRHGADGPVGAGGPEATRAPTRRASATTSAGSRSRRSPAEPAPPTDGVGGGNGIAVGKNAPPEAIDFLKFFNSVDNGNKLEHRQRRPVRRRSARRARSRTRTSRPSSTVAARRSSCSCTSTRQRPRRSEPGDQRRDDRAVPRRVHSGEGLPGPHGRGSQPSRPSQRATLATDSERAGVAGPLVPPR